MYNVCVHRLYECIIRVKRYFWESLPGTEALPPTNALSRATHAPIYF